MWRQTQASILLAGMAVSMGLSTTTVAGKMIEIPLYKKEVPASQHVTDMTKSSVSAAQANKQKKLAKRFSKDDQSLATSTTPADMLNYEEFELGNLSNAQYYGKLYIGSDRQEHEFIFDTGSPWLWMASDACTATSCHTTDVFQTQTSTTFERISNQRKELYYESGSAEGYVAADRVCLSADDSVCVDEMLFIEVDKTDLSALRFNGVLGLSPGSTKIATSLYNEETNSYLENLYNNGIIDQRIFSLYISDEDNFRNVSMFTVGGYDLERFGNNQNVTWNKVTDNTYWTVEMTGANIGDTMVITSTDNAIIDSGTSNMAMPQKEIASLVSLLDSVYGFECSFEDFNQLYACECPDINAYKTTFPNMTITLSETNTYEIPYYEYTERRNNLCYITIDNLGTSDFWILGDPFLRHYYAIFDLDNQLVGLAGSSVQESFQLTFTELAAYLGIGIMALVILRVTYLMCKKEPRRPAEAPRQAVDDDYQNPNEDLRQPLVPGHQQQPQQPQQPAY